MTQLPRVTQGQPSDPTVASYSPRKSDSEERNKHGKNKLGKNYSIKGKDKAVKTSSPGEDKNAQLDKMTPKARQGPPCGWETNEAIKHVCGSAPGLTSPPQGGSRWRWWTWLPLR